MLTIFVAGFFIALSFAAPPGPVLMETMRRGMRGGFKPGFAVQIGSTIGDFAWCAAALLGAAPLLRMEWLRVPWTIIGVGILGYLGARAILDGIREKPPTHMDAPQEKSGALRSGILISLGNPMALGYWFAVGGAMASSGLFQSAGALHYFVFALGFALAMVIWAFCMAALAGWGRRIPGIWFFRGIHLACGAFLLFFSLQMASTLFLR